LHHATIPDRFPAAKPAPYKLQSRVVYYNMNCDKLFRAETDKNHARKNYRHCTQDNYNDY